MRLKHYILVAVAVLILAPLAIVYGVLRSSLPQLDGTVGAAGVAAPIKIERDRRGAPTITAANRIDLAYGTGFVHGQDRFFEMDLSRRLAGGELSELFGKVAVEQDRQARLFHFRKIALQVMQQATPEQRAIVEAYTRGVNAGLASLSSRPWEYWLIGAPPVPWRPEDTVLVVDSMWWDLQANGIYREILRREINARIGGKECDAGWKCGLRFDHSANVLKPKNSQANAALEQIKVRFGRTQEPLWVLVPGKHETEVAQRLVEVNGALSQAASNQFITDLRCRRRSGRSRKTSERTVPPSPHWCKNEKHSSPPP